MPDTAIPIPWTPKQDARMQDAQQSISDGLRAIAAALQGMGDAAAIAARSFAAITPHARTHK